MKTSIKSLEKASKDLKRINEIDSEINKIEKLALQIANDPCKISLNLSIENLSPESEEKKAVLDEDGSLTSDCSSESIYSHYMRAAMENAFRVHVGGCSNDKKKVKSESIGLKTSENTALAILGIMLSELKDERQKLINKLTKHGFQFA